MVSFFMVLMISLVLGGCGFNKDVSINLEKMQFASPRIVSTTLAGVPVTDESQIKDTLVEVFHKQLSEFNIIISANDGVHAAGSSLISGESHGRTWYAIKAKGGWQIVWQGNEEIKCSDLSAYPDYPSKYIPECVDDAGKIVKR